MKVHQLIAKLQQHDPNTDVVLETTDGLSGHWLICDNLEIGTLREVQNFLNELYDDEEFPAPVIQRNLDTVTIIVQEVVTDKSQINPEWLVLDPIDEE